MNLTPRTRTFIAVVVWIAAIALAMSADRAVANFARDHQIPQFLKSTGLATALKMPGEFWFTAVVAVAAVLLYKREPRWHAGAFILLCGTLSGVNGLIKWLTGRARPFKMLASNKEVDLHPFAFQPLFHGLPGLFGTSNLCFPSGHAALAFATAAGLAILSPRFRWIFYGVATLTACERFLENAHYLSDNVAAAALGIGGAHLIAWALSPTPDTVEPRGFSPVLTPENPIP